MELIDFTNFEKSHRLLSCGHTLFEYATLNGVTYTYDYAPSETNNRDNKIYNRIYNEYLCSRIARSVGLDTPDTFLGIYYKDEKKYDIVAYNDFIGLTREFATFLGWSNSVFTEVTNDLPNCRPCDIDFIIDVIYHQKPIYKQELEKRFWDMFVFDAYIGNWSRNTSSWGTLYEQESDTHTFSPLFGFGKSVFPQSIKKQFNKSADSFSNFDILSLVESLPDASLTFNGNHIIYHRTLLDPEFRFEGFDKALARFQNNYDTNKIRKIFEEFAEVKNPEIANLYIRILNARKRKIIDAASRFNGVNFLKEDIKTLS